MRYQRSAAVVGPPHRSLGRQRDAPDDSKERTYYLTFAPVGTLTEVLVEVAGQRWNVEEDFEHAKGEVGWDHYDVRHWIGWYRHITLAMLALAYLAVVRARLHQPPVLAAKGGAETKGTAELACEMLPMTVPEVRRLVYQLIWQPTTARPHSTLVGLASAASTTGQAQSLSALYDTPAAAVREVMRSPWKECTPCP